MDIFLVVDGLSVLTLIGAIIIGVLLLDALVALLRKKSSALSVFVSRHGLMLMFIVSLVATLGSLFLSEIAGWTPCKDCWLQRIVMYPQVVILGIALWKKDRSVALYVLAFCLIGIVLSTDHYIDQVMEAMKPIEVDPAVPCDDTGVSCAKTQIHFRFGYITIPMMALTAFVLNALGSITMMRKRV